MGVKCFDTHKWPTVLVRQVRGKPKQICVDHYILILKRLSNHIHFIDQLVRSKATCSFKETLPVRARVLCAPGGFVMVNVYSSILWTMICIKQHCSWIGLSNCGFLFRGVGSKYSLDFLERTLSHTVVLFSQFLNLY